MIILSPSILAADFKNLGSQIEETKKAGAQYVHIDVGDGLFVPQITFGMPVIKSIRPATDQVFDVHLMIRDPERYIGTFAECGADIITFHLESTTDVGACIAAIEQAGRKVSMAIKPGTPVEAARPYLERLDMLLVMTVEPGFGGQRFIPASMRRIREARQMIDEINKSRPDRPIDIEVDGGITRQNVSAVLDAGANVIVAGSAIYRGDVCDNTKYFMDTFAERENRQ